MQPWRQRRNAEIRESQRRKAMTREYGGLVHIESAAGAAENDDNGKRPTCAGFARDEQAAHGAAFPCVTGDGEIPRFRARDEEVSIKRYGCNNAPPGYYWRDGVEKDSMWRGTRLGKRRADGAILFRPLHGPKEAHRRNAAIAAAARLLRGYIHAAGSVRTKLSMRSPGASFVVFGGGADCDVRVGRKADEANADFFVHKRGIGRDFKLDFSSLGERGGDGIPQDNVRNFSP